jgi:predicted negative regulator of RcsB-dependent stress response
MSCTLKRLVVSKKQRPNPGLVSVGQTAYFAARAALQAGQILEKRGQKLEAIAFYEQCLAMEEHSYKNSLDQRAKAGIARCK